MTLTLTPVTYDGLAGWRQDHVAAALPALLRSCARIAALDPGSPLDRRVGGTFGRAGDWQQACGDAAVLPLGDDGAARRFFEADYLPMLVAGGGMDEGLFTGYFEIELEGSRQRQGIFQTPLYRRPSDPTRYSRAEIEDGALAGQGLELFWVSDPIAAFFLEIQGSGRLRLRDGSVVQVGYDGANGHSYVAVGGILVERGILARKAVSMQAIRGWMAAHPVEGAELRRENPSYVFFHVLRGGGPVGAEAVVLTPGRSLAVDRAYIALGVPIWLEADQRFTSGSFRRLVVAQDTGGAIKGAVRGDLFWGAGEEASAGAGTMNASGRYYLLLPRPVAARVAARGTVLVGSAD